MTSLSRRGTLAFLGGAAASACAPGRISAPPRLAAQPVTALRDLASEKGIRFGSAMSTAQLDDPQYVDIVLKECEVIVAENAHKWYTIHPAPDSWRFEPADALVDFARRNELAMRGHTLLWHRTRWSPKWVNELEFASAAEAEKLLGDYITKVAERYHPFIDSWDVINETIDPPTGEMRDTSFSRVMGEGIVEFCFHKAKEAAPDATLAYNDYMSWERGNEKHRTGVLKMLERLRSKDIPIDALGIQSHSNYDMPDEFTPEKQLAWRKFCDEVAGLGLDIYLTEFDVNDTRLSPDIETRDKLIASFTKDYLDLMFSYPQTKDLLMWGLVDDQNWLQDFLPREDGVEKRPTLYDSGYKPKLMREAVAAALKAAPVR